MTTADAIVAALKLKPHPEGGYFRETFRDAAAPKRRAHSTAIYFLLKRGQRSHWHRVDAAEIWHWHRGGPIELMIAQDRKTRRFILGNRVENGEHPHVAVPAGAWQAARPLGAYTLVSCTVAPGFEFDGFELAPPDFDPAAISGAGPSKARGRSRAKRRARHTPRRD